MRNSSRNIRPIAEINLVPYIDVMLVLLVIFMITAPMFNQGVAVELPKTHGEALTNLPHEPIIVSINKDGKYFLNVHNTPNVPLDTKTLLVRIRAELELARIAQEKINILVKGDQDVAYGKVVLLMDLLKQAGIAQIGLVTEHTQSMTT